MPESCLSNAFPISYDLQSACPLFTRIPPEIRNSIFKLALTEYDDTEHPYEQSAAFCRPEYQFRHRIDTDLLRTCRRIYLETYLIPVGINEHVFWCYRGPPGRRYAPDPHGYFEMMTSEQLEAVDTVHFFTQQFWLEGQFRNACQIPSMRPRKIKITLRRTDWWVWEAKAKLGIDPRLAGRVPWSEMGREPVPDELEVGFGYPFRYLRGLRELEMEFETTQSQMAELEAIVQRALAWEFDLHDGSVLSTEGTAVFERMWRCGEPGRQQYYLNDDWHSGVDQGAISEGAGPTSASNSVPNPNHTQNSEPTEGVEAAPVLAQESATHSGITYVVFNVTWRAQPRAPK